MLKPPAERYRTRHPGPEDVLLVIEVAHATRQTERTLKAQLYASAGIPEYWIYNLGDGQLEIHRRPDQDEARYLGTRVLNERDVVDPLASSCDLAWWR